jgi:hypothetical protein
VFGGTSELIGAMASGTTMVMQATPGAIESPPDILGGMSSSFGRIGCMMVVFGAVLLGLSRYAAQRGLHYEGDPWAALIRSARISRKRRDAWAELDAAVNRHRQR